MSRIVLICVLLAACEGGGAGNPDATSIPDAAPVLIDVIPAPECDDPWSQWGGNSAHTGASCGTGGAMKERLADVTMDPFALVERAQFSGELLVHYQVPLVIGDDVYMQFKAGTYTPCVILPPPQNTISCETYRWESEVFTEKRLTWEGGRLVEKWRFDTDWKPLPTQGFQPMFQPALFGAHIYLPGGGGAVFKVDRMSGELVSHIKPFGAAIDPGTYAVGALAIDREGNVFYTVIKLNRDNPFGADQLGFLVKVTPDDDFRVLNFQDLVLGAPQPTDLCRTIFNRAIHPLPWPPADNPDGTPVLPPEVPCGSQRPGANAAPAIGPDGTIFVVSRGTIDRYSYLSALRPDLTTRWSKSLRGIVADGCGVLIPRDGDEGQNRGNCRPGSRFGVDPSTNELPAGRVIHDSSSSPVALPDGGVVYGAFTDYNTSRGHMVRLDSDGMVAAVHDFGWDTTPAIWVHDDTYSIITKDNHYGKNSDGFDTGPFEIVQYDKDFNAEWRFKNTSTMSCTLINGELANCVEDHPNGFEWCINAAAVDRFGVVYVNGEDGYVYAIHQGGVQKERYFLSMALGAAYTPLAVDAQGRIFTLNNGLMTVLGTR